MKKLEPPLESLDPTDWLMYCDLLQDAGAPRRRWLFARSVAESLKVSTELVLVLACSSVSLEGHWLRVGKGWFVPTRLTNIERYTTGQAWWRRDWVRRGFARYPYRTDRYGPRNEERMIDFARGTPWRHKHPAFELFRGHWGLPALVEQFFRGHGLQRMPPGWG